MAIWVIKDGQREGPYEEQDVRELVYEGTYRDSDPAIRDGQFDWTTLGKILGHAAPQVEAPASSATEPPQPPPMPPELPPASPAAPAAQPLPVPGVAETKAQELTGPEASAGPAQPIRVSVTDFQMPFGSMVVLMVKWVLASIPALLILGAIAAVFWTALFALVAVVLRH